MENSEVKGLDQIQFDAANLYIEETITDLRVGAIRRLTPIDKDGKRDLSRPVLFFAQAQVMSQLGALPVSAAIEAKNLDEAIRNYPKAVQAGVEALMAEAREMQRQEMSRIVVPDAGSASKILKP